jgi:RHS repeat-associated protein
MGARLYNNDFGRFIQNDFQTDSSRDADLAGETLTQNRYAFAAANPLLYVETDGHGFCRRFPKLCQPPHSICHDPSSCQPRPRRWPSCPAGQRGLPLYYPYDRKLAIGKVDAGVDSKRHHVGPIFAIAGCTITKIDPVGSSSWGGLGAVYFRLDRPIHWGPRTYSKWYTAESSDRNRINNPKKLYVGKHFRAGQQILTTNSGWQETGFDAGQYMSDGPTGPGYDFRAFILFLRNRCYLAPGA